MLLKKILEVIHSEFEETHVAVSSEETLFAIQISNINVTKKKLGGIYIFLNCCILLSKTTAT